MDSVKTEMARLTASFLVILLLIFEVVIADEGQVETTTKIDLEVINSRLRFDTCHLPMQPGKCRHGVPSWYYNHKLQKCLRFVYTLCGGNDNRFYKKEECEEYCIEYK